MVDRHDSHPGSRLEAGQRLDEVVAARLGSSRGFAHRLIENGYVKVNQRTRAKGYRLKEGDGLWIDRTQAAQGDTCLPEPGARLTVRYEDRYLVVVDKPAGQASHPLRPGERGTLAGALVGRYPEMASIGYSPREPGLIHRLDVGTSGLLIAARDAETFRRLRHALAAGRLDKRYLALVAGRPHPAVCAAFLRADGPTVKVFPEPGEQRVSIETELLRVWPGPQHARVELRASPARRHQLRAHTSFLGHPMYGDLDYGGEEAFDGQGHVLHASSVGFIHPVYSREIRVEAPIPPRFQRCCRRAGLES